MRRVLAVLEMGDRIPSGIVRGLVYRDLFCSNGFSTEFVSRLPLEALDWLDRPPRLLRRIISRPWINHWLKNKVVALHQNKIICRASESDIVYLSKVLSWPLIRDLREKTTARLVYDFGDAVWLYFKDREEFHQILRIVDAVTTDNDLTADYIRGFNKNCTVIPDTPQIGEFDKFRDTLKKKPNDRIVLGWIGTPSTLYNLYEIWDVLEELFQKHSNLHLRLVGTGDNLQLLPPFERVRYSVKPYYDQGEMIKEVFGMHVGLFPLQNIEKSRVRGVLKATVYMSGEAVVIGSPIGQSSNLIEDGMNGLLANSKQEWIEKMEAVILNPKLRDQLIQGGLETVRSQFRLDQSFAKLKDVLLGDNLIKV